MDNNNAKHPDSTFSAEYPYNQSTITRSGHEIHLNDTPGSESIKIAHTRGTYFEVNSTGQLTQVVVDKAYSYYMDGLSVTVDGHKDVKVGGALNINVDGSISEQTAGNKYLTMGGSFVAGIGDSYYEHVTNDKLLTVGGSLSSMISGDINTSVGGNKVEVVQGTKVDVLNNDWSVTSPAGIEYINGGIFRIKCKQFIIEAETITLTTSIGDITVTASGNVTVKGQQINWN